MLPDYDASTYAWIAWLSWFGGIVAYFQRIKKHGCAAFSWWVFVIESVTSIFIGLITFYLCEYWKMPGEFTAGSIALTGHMGTRAIFLARRKLLAITDEHENSKTDGD